MNLKIKLGAIVTAALLTVTSATASSFTIPGFGGSDLDNNIISVYEITGADTIENGVEQILGSVREYGLEEYQEQVDEGVEQPYFWLAKPLNKKADNVVDMFAPDFTKGVNEGGCFEKHFHIHMEDGESISDSVKHAKEEIPGCMEENASPLGEFASKVRQMLLCQPKHGQLLLESADNLHFAAAMPCHLSIYEKDGKIYVAWRNVEKMAEQSELDSDANDLAKEVQEAMEEMLGNL